MNSPDELNRRIENLERELEESRRREEQLTRERDWLKTFMEFLPQPVFEINQEGRLTYANRKAFEQYGYTREEFDRGLMITNMVIPEDRTRAREDIKRAMSGERWGGVEYTALCKNGDSFPVIANSVMYFEGDRIGGFRGMVTDISAHKKIEEALRESESNYRRLVEMSPDIVFAIRVFRETVTQEERERILRLTEEIRRAPAGEIDAVCARVFPDLREYIDGGFVFINETAADILEYPLSLLQNKKLTDLVIPGQVNRISLNIIKILAEKIRRGREYTLMRSDGITLEISINSRLSDKEYPFIIEGVARDITYLKSAEEALRKSERRYRSIFESIPVSIWEHDFRAAMPLLESIRAKRIVNYREYLEEHPDILMEIISKIRISDVNNGTIRMYGAASKEEILKGLYSHRHIPEAVRVYRDTIAEYLEEKEYFACETVNETVDGRRIDVIIHMAFTENSDQSGIVLQTVTDITERKRAEQALRESESKFRNIVEHSAEGIVMVNEKGDIIEWNHSAEKMIGISRDEALGGKVWSFMSPIVDGKRKTHEREAYFRKMTETILHTGEGKFLNRLCEIPIYRKGGEKRIFQLVLSPIRTECGFMVVVISHDITDQKRQEEERRKNDRLESIGLLAGGIAHDYNNILVAIMGNLSLAKLDVEESSELFEILSEAEQATLRARDLTQQLLAFSKGGAPVKETASITEIIRESAGFMLRGANVRCEFSFAETLRAVEVDRGQMSQVINNLILNAVQAMPEGGVITVSAWNVRVGMNERLPLEPGEYVVITVRDRGCGISQENLGRVFDPYFTTKEKGSGLGLTTTYSIIRNHGGHIAVESVKGSGATFTIHLPASEGVPQKCGKSPQKEECASGRILLMDDDETVRRAISRMLTHLGHEVRAACDGAEAVAFYKEAMEKECPFDAVIMDLTVPGGMGGREAMEKLLAMDPKCRAIVSSGYSSEQVAAEHREFGFRAALSKPYRMNELRDTLNRILREAE